MLQRHTLDRSRFVDDLQALRAQLDRIDADLVAKAAERQQLVARIGRCKQRQGRELRDFAREREVLERAADEARKRGIDPVLAQRLLMELIEASLQSQERERLGADAAGAGRRALVIGGGGRMGRWMSRFLHDQDWSVTVADPAGSPEHFAWTEDWQTAAAEVDLIVVATPLRAAAGILLQLAALKPSAVVLEIGSVKAPLAPALRALAAAGVEIASIHPMFGPSANLLAGRHVIIVELGCSGADRLARELFQATMATLSTMPLDAHDRLAAWVLGLSHALNIAFAAALGKSTEEAAALSAMSSTTFDRQIEVAAHVVVENPNLYFEIQRLNPHGRAAREALATAVDRLAKAIDGDDPEAFASMMAEGSRALSLIGPARPSP